MGLKFIGVFDCLNTYAALKSDHIGIEMMTQYNGVLGDTILKSDHIGIEMRMRTCSLLCILILKSDHIGIEIYNSDGDDFPEIH